MMLRTKLVIGFLGISLLISGLGMVTLTGLHSAEEAFTVYDQNTVRELDLTREMSRHLHMAIINTQIYAITDDPAYREYAQNHLAALNDTQQIYLQQPSLHLGDTLRETNENTIQTITTAIAMQDRGAPPEDVITELERIASTNTSTMQFYHHTLSPHINEKREITAANTYTAFKHTTQLTVLVSLFSVFIGSVAGLYLSRRISHPLNRLQKIINDISRGNLEVTIDPELKQRNDEIGGVAQAFDRTLTSLKLAMKRTAPELEEKVEEAEQEKQELAEERKEMLSLLEAALDVSSEAILITDLDGKFRRYNQRLVEMWDLPKDIMSSGDASSAVEHVKDKVKHPKQFKERVEYLVDHPEEEAQDLVQMKDGTVIERYAQPLRADSDIIGRVWQFKEVDTGDTT